MIQFLFFSLKKFKRSSHQYPSSMIRKRLLQLVMEIVVQHSYTRIGIGRIDYKSQQQIETEKKITGTWVTTDEREENVPRRWRWTWITGTGNENFCLNYYIILLCSEKRFRPVERENIRPTSNSVWIAYVLLIELVLHYSYYTILQYGMVLFFRRRDSFADRNFAMDL